MADQLMTQADRDGNQQVAGGGAQQKQKKGGMFCCCGGKNQEDGAGAGGASGSNNVASQPTQNNAAAPNVPGPATGDHVLQSGNMPANLGLLGPQHKDHVGRKTLVLDLDETLVHSSFKPVPDPDYVVPIEIDGNTHHVYVLKRPHVDKFLTEMGKLYEVVLFTASLSKYADPVTDLLDPQRVCRHRLFREHCVFHHGSYVKDLSRLGRDLTQTIIVDNSPMSYSFHPENAVPCKSWFDDRSDTELNDLIPFFKKLDTVRNVCEVLT